MENTRGPLQPEEYLEPQCPLCETPYGDEPSQRSIPQRRVIEKLDDYMSRRDYAGAERHLLYWLEEARMCRDLRGELLLRNELVGHYRKTGEADKAREQGDRALALLKELGFEETISAGTTYTNVATARQAFGDPEGALELFERARAVYESVPRTGDELLGGLYNNMALTCAALGRYDLAYDLYDRAMERMAAVPGGELEQAVTCLNRANALEAQLGLEAAEEPIARLLDQAQELLENSDHPRDGYYAFVCEKCAPTFSYYGYFLAARELSRRAEEIYERA